MNKLERNNVQFDYFSSNYQRFEDDFYRFANINIPLTFLTDDILKMMCLTKRNYFRLNALNTKYKRDRYFSLKSMGMRITRNCLGMSMWGMVILSIFNILKQTVLLKK